MNMQHEHVESCIQSVCSEHQFLISSRLKPLSSSPSSPELSSSSSPKWSSWWIHRETNRRLSANNSFYHNKFKTRDSLQLLVAWFRKLNVHILHFKQMMSYPHAHDGDDDPQARLRHIFQRLKTGSFFSSSSIMIRARGFDRRSKEPFTRDIIFRWDASRNRLNLSNHSSYSQRMIWRWTLKGIKRSRGGIPSSLQLTGDSEDEGRGESHLRRHFRNG